MPDRRLDIGYPKSYENHIREIKSVWNEEEERALGPDWKPYIYEDPPAGDYHRWVKVREAQLEAARKKEPCPPPRT